MAIALRGTGTIGQGTASFTLTVPAAQLTGDMMFAVAWAKPFDAAWSMPGDWTSLGSGASGSTAAGIDVGSVKVQVWYKKAFDEVVGPRYLKSSPPPGVTKEAYVRQHAAVEYLTDHFHEAPVWIVACIEEAAVPTRWSGASIYPAVQNMLLAARALGLGATLTTRHLLYEKEAEAALGLPPGVHSYAILPIGYPMGKFGPVGRGPLKEVVYEDQWGRPFLGGEAS